jgi:hypothetical protein
VAEQASSDWIEHDGAGCPVSDLAQVRVRFRGEDRREAEMWPALIEAYACSDNWTYAAGSTCAVDIVEYQVVA